MLTAAGPSVGKRGSCIGLHEDPGTYALGIIHLDWVGCFIWFFVFDLDGKHIYPQLYASFFILSYSLFPLLCYGWGPSLPMKGHVFFYYITIITPCSPPLFLLLFCVSSIGRAG